MLVSDLTRQSLAVPAVRVVTPGLPLDRSDLVSPRLQAAILQAAILETGGGAVYTGGERLL